MRPTEHVTVTVTGLQAKPLVYSLPPFWAKEVRFFLEATSQNADKEDSIPAHKVLPELADDTLRPAAVLRGSRYKENMTQRELAAKLGIRQHHLSEMENAKRAISKDMAHKLAKVLKCDYRLFL